MRWATSAALAAHGTDPGTGPLPVPGNVVYLATGRDFPDTLTASPAVAYRGGLLLLADADDPSAAFLDAHRPQIDQTIAIGGCRTASLQPAPGFEEPEVC